MAHIAYDISALNKLPILDVSKRLGLELRQRRCLCFIHPEKTSSFVIDNKRNRWHCYGCGKDGSVIDLVKEYYTLSFTEACSWLSDEYNLNTRSYFFRREKIKIPKKSLSQNQIKFQPDYEIYNWFFKTLSVTKNVVEYIKKRRYPTSVIEKFGLKGLDNCNHFLNICIDTWGTERLINSGIIKLDKNSSTQQYRLTWWTNTLFFPFYDLNGNITYIQGRTINPDKEAIAKYVNLNGVSTSLYNQQILNSIKINSQIIITEGVMDCIACDLMNMNAIGIVGASGFKSEYTQLLKLYKIIVVPDNDKNGTGMKFANDIKKKFLSMGITIQILPLDDCYKDISDYYYKKWQI